MTYHYSNQPDLNLLFTLAKSPIFLGLSIDHHLYPPSTILKMRGVIWSELRKRMKRNPNLSTFLRRIWIKSGINKQYQCLNNKYFLPKEVSSEKIFQDSWIETCGTA